VDTRDVGVDSCYFNPLRVLLVRLWGGMEGRRIVWETGGFFKSAHPFGQKAVPFSCRSNIFYAVGKRGDGGSQVPGVVSFPIMESRKSSICCFFLCFGDVTSSFFFFFWDTRSRKGEMPRGFRGGRPKLYLGNKHCPVVPLSW